MFTIQSSSVSVITPFTVLSQDIPYHTDVRMDMTGTTDVLSASSPPPSLSAAALFASLNFKGVHCLKRSTEAPVT